MRSYLFHRILRALLTLIGISILVFIAVRLSGDPTLSLASEDPTPQEIASIRAELGLDQPIWMQYLKFAGHAVQGDFGNSIRYHRPALDLVLGRLPPTLQLGLISFAVTLVMGLLLGVLAALQHNKPFDLFARLGAVLGQSVPGFWLGMMAVLVFSVGWQILPSSGRGGAANLIMPVIALSLFSIASIMRLTRSTMLEALEGDYVRFLRSKGLPERLIIWKHALRNAFIPILVVLGLQLGNMVGGTIIVETVFNWPGLGRLMVEALNTRDYALIQAGAFIISIFMITTNLAVDLLFGVVDPRIRHQIEQQR